MRKPRRQTLGDTGVFHKMWRGHNREPILESPVDKKAYLRHLGDTLTEKVRNHVAWHSFSEMTNHTHETGSSKADDHGDYDQSIQVLGDWMRNAHSRFGAEYNRRYQRQGKVAYDRPKTTQITGEQGLLQVMFYGDANPVRAGMVSHPSRYQWSSYRYYAYGETNELTAHLTPPDSYLALGATPRQRQKRYRQLCDLYLRQAGLIEDRPLEEVPQPPELAEIVVASPPGNADYPPTRGDP